MNKTYEMLNNTSNKINIESESKAIPQLSTGGKIAIIGGEHQRIKKLLDYMFDENIHFKF